MVTNMNEDKVIQLTRQIIREELRAFEQKKPDFRRWNPQDSVTDRFSPITGASQKIGFFGMPKTSKPTMSGAKAGNAALTSVVSVLSALGLATDSTS